MGPLYCPATSVRNYPYTLCNNPEERSSQIPINVVIGFILCRMQVHRWNVPLKLNGESSSRMPAIDTEMYCLDSVCHCLTLLPSVSSVLTSTDGQCCYITRARARARAHTHTHTHTHRVLLCHIGQPPGLTVEITAARWLPATLATICPNTQKPSTLSTYVFNLLEPEFYI